MDFYRRVARVCCAIPYGRVATYGQIAMLCGKPRNARQVGYALNRRIEDKVPAHRVVNHQGCLSGAAAFAVPDLQKRLLEMEGVMINGDQVDLKKFGWKNTLEEATLLKAVFEEEQI